MKFFGWMQNKTNGDHNRISTSSASSSSYHVKQEPREEFSEWPHALLAIGTFGTTSNCVSQSQSKNETEPEKNKCTTQSEQQEEPEPSSSDDLEDFTPEEVGKLQKELMKILSRTKKRKSDVNRELMKNLPLDRFLNCPSSLEVDRRISNVLNAVVDSSDENKEEDMERKISVILGRCKEITIESKKNKKKRDISKSSSVSYLFKKMFVCADGISISPNPSLRDTLQETRMEKLLKMMLHKKINTQASSKPTSSRTNRYLQDKKQPSLKSDKRHLPLKSEDRYLEDNKQLSLKSEEEEEETKERRSSSDRYKWVKTDSDFIVLEI